MSCLVSDCCSVEPDIEDEYEIGICPKCEGACDWVDLDRLHEEGKADYDYECAKDERLIDEFGEWI